MKKLLLSSLAATTLLMGCGGEKPPEECYDMIDTMMKMAELAPSGQAAAQVPSADEARAEMEKEWETMTEEKREEATKKCKQANAMFKMLEGMK